MKKEIHISGEIGYNYTLETLNGALNALDSEVVELDIYINSGGGSVTEGFAIYDKLMTLPYTVNTIVNGMCGSIATVIFQAGKKGKRRMYKNAEFFVHNPFWMPNYPEAMEAKDLEALAQDLKNAENKIKNFYSEITSKSIEELTPILDRQTTLTANEAIEWGFVDEIVGKEIEAYTRYRLVAYFDKKTINNKMENQKLETELTGINKILAQIKSRLFKNKTAELQDGTVIYFAEDEVSEGVVLYLDEAMVEKVPDADHILSDGSIAVTVDGVITEIKSVEDETEVEALKAEVEALKSQLADKDALVAKQETILNETKNNVEVLASKVKAFENMVVTGKNTKVIGTQANHNSNVEAPKDAMSALKAFRDKKVK
jgi:ATP-dependent Clp protease protease subunit